MSEHCTSRVRVTGPGASLDRFASTSLRTHDGRVVLVLDALVPNPHDSSSPDYLDWAEDHWGFRDGPLCEVKLLGRSPGEISFEVTTRIGMLSFGVSGSPAPWASAVVDTDATLRIVILWNNEFGAAGLVTVAHGALIDVAMRSAALVGHGWRDAPWVFDQ